MSWLNLTLLEIIEEYKNGSENEPLDKNDVKKLTHIIQGKINLHEGNITEDEYNIIVD